MQKPRSADVPTVEQILERLTEVEQHLSAIRSWALLMQEAVND